MRLWTLHLPGVRAVCDNKSGPAQCANTESGPRRSTTSEEVIAVALSVPPTPDNAPTVGYAARMARVDGCPEACGNYETPSSVWPDPPRGFIANYVCTDCGHAWSTSWEDC